MGRTKNHGWVNLLFVILTPVLVFSLKMLYDLYFFNVPFSVDSYLVHFRMLYEVIKSYKDYIFPFIFCLALGLIYIALHFISKRRPSGIAKFFIFLFSVYIIMTGSRILFVIVNKYTARIFDFIHDGINIYTLSFAASLEFIIMWILSLFSFNQR